jgi:hypothetical protein
VIHPGWHEGVKLGLYSFVNNSQMKDVEEGFG